ncbi:HD domain-containing protein [Candidatus Microgenomates bacterium]|nr:MAG: HD domain-containing protein [Candidatus Microgenomates bacterium]
MDKKLKDFHHYKGNGLTRFEKVERRVIELIYSSEVPDGEREESKFFEFMHAWGCVAVAKILAQKRGLNIDLAVVIASLHDIYVIINGKYKDHAKLGVEISEKILREVGGFSDEEIETIKDAVLHHSEKEIYSNDPYSELIKDVDVFESSMYKNSEGYYILHKAKNIVEECVNRIKKVRKELGLPIDNVFRK